ncbi:MAG: PAS domain-containing protein [Rubrivivax sp.]
MQANDAALRWSQLHGLSEADWRAFAAARESPAAPEVERLEIGPRRQPLTVRRVTLADGGLFFWLDAGAEELAQHAQLVADAVGVGFWSRDLDAGIAWWDEQMYRIHRRRPEEGPPDYGDWIARHVHPADHAWVAELHRRANEEWRPVVDVTFRVPDGAGGERWVQTWTRRLRRGGRRVAFGMHMDVTDREHARALIERERASARFAIEAAELGVWERSLDGRLVYWNEPMYRLRGLDPADPRPLEELARITTHPDDHAAIAPLVRQHVAEGRPYHFEFRVQRPDGQWRWLVTQGRALRDPQGRVSGVAGINLDVTERKQAEALRFAKARAEQASRDKSAFMSRLSHELRTPMNAVLGFTQLLLADEAEPPSARQRARLGRIGEAGAQMMTLVDELLQLAQADEAAAPASPAGGPEGEAPGDAPPLRVLCVEDNPVNLLLVRELLARRPQVQLLEAVDGRSAIEVALAQRPDLLLVDLHLPDIDGVQVLARLRPEPALAHSTFVALSANALPEQIAAARAAGFDDYWTKPIDFGRFLAGIDRIARDQGASRSRSQPPPSAGR